MKTHTFSDWLPILIKTVLLLAGIAGQMATTFSEDFMSSAALMFFTNQSNLWSMAVIAVLLVYDVLELFRGSAAPKPPNWLLAVRFVFTVAILLTFLVFSVLLTPQLIAEGKSDYLSSVGNICAHNLVPLLALLDWILYGAAYRSTRKSFLLGAIMPLYYVVFALGCSFLGIGFGEGRKVPYFFFDYEANGWLSIRDGKIGVVYWLLLLAVVVLALSYVLIAVKNRAATARGARMCAADANPHRSAEI